MDDVSSSPYSLQKAETVFISYASRDKALKERLEEHLCNLQYRGLITLWYEGEILAGDEWEEEITQHMEKASVVLLLISSSFMVSRYCYSVEMRQALDRYERGLAKVIPILLRPVMFTNAPFARLQALPSNGKSITTWKNRDSAFVDVALGIEKVLLQQRGSASGVDDDPHGRLRSPSSDLPLLYAAWQSSRFSLLRWLQAFSQGIFAALNGVLSRTSGQQRRAQRAYYRRVLRAYEEALMRHPADLVALKGKGIALEALEDYTQALAVFRQSIAITPHAFPYTRIGDIYVKQKRFQDAVEAYEQAVICDPQCALAYDGLGQALTGLGQSSAAEQAYGRARQAGYEPD